MIDDPFWPWSPFLIVAGMLAAMCLFRWARTVLALVLAILAYLLIARLVSPLPPL